MPPRVVSFWIALVLLSGCGPDQAKIKENKERADRLKAELEESERQAKERQAKRTLESTAQKQWDKSKPRVAALLEKKRQLEKGFPVPWTQGTGIEQEIRATKARLTASKNNLERKEHQERLDFLENEKKVLEENSTTYTRNTILYLEALLLKMERAGIDPSVDNGKEIKEKIYYKNEQIKKDRIDELRSSLRYLREFTKKLEEIERQLEAASK